MVVWTFENGDQHQLSVGELVAILLPTRSARFVVGQSVDYRSSLADQTLRGTITAEPNPGLNADISNDALHFINCGADDYTVAFSSELRAIS
jgi:hypothetical protein